MNSFDLPNPNVLVVTPTLGDRPKIATTILSVKHYGGDAVLHVIVGPIKKVRPLQRSFPWVILLDDSSKNGVYSAINYALQCYGHDYEFFTYINDDDSWSHDYIYLLRTILSDKSLGMVYGRVFYGSMGSITSIGPKFPFASYFPRLSALGIPFITQQALIVRTNLIFDNGCFPESLPISADSALWAKIIMNSNNIRFVDRFCAFYEQRGERISNNKNMISLNDKFKTNLKYKISAKIWNIFIIAFYRLFNVPVYLVRFMFYRP